MGDAGSTGLILLTPQERKKRYWQFSSLEIVYWFAMATAGYLTVYLKGIGFSPSQIGKMSAVNSAVGIIAAPLFGLIADKIGSVKKVFITCILVGSLLWALVPFTGTISFGPILLCLIVIPASQFFRNPASSLVDNWVVQSTNKEGLNYGTIRLWGSISYAGMALILAAILPRYGVKWTFYMLFLLIIPMVLVSISIKDKGKTTVRKSSLPFRELRVGRLFKNYYYVTFLIYAIVLNIPMQTGHVFLPYLISHVGGDTARLGLITGYKALLEIPMLFLLKPLRKRKFPLYGLLLGSAPFLCFRNAVISPSKEFYAAYTDLDMLRPRRRAFDRRFGELYLYTDPKGTQGDGANAKRLCHRGGGHSWESRGRAAFRVGGDRELLSVHRVCHVRGGAILCRQSICGQARV